MTKYALISTLLFFVLGACKPKVKETKEMVVMPAEFRDFYAKFHSDTAYQMKHITFPLQGLPQDVDSATLADRDFFYTADTWLKHQPIDFSKGEFRQELTRFSDRMVMERIYRSDNAFGMERRFAKLEDNEWYLIYYVAPNRIVKVTE
jgi:hypothetical protein